LQKCPYHNKIAELAGLQIKSHTAARCSCVAKKDSSGKIPLEKSTPVKVLWCMEILFHKFVKLSMEDCPPVPHGNS
jgi:hypothetical protein